MTGRERVLSLLAGRAVDRLPLMPITMMFAARHVGVPYGRYALDHRVLVEAQTRTARDFDFDHVSTITETREAPDCGAAIELFDDQPFAVDESRSRLAEKAVLKQMDSPDPWSAPHMSDRLKALSLLDEKEGSVRVVEGWVEGPCGAAADLRGINRLMLDFYDDPAFVRDLFEFVLDVGLAFGEAQVKAGANIIGIGDPAASLVGPALYEEFVRPVEGRLVEGLHAAGACVRLHICGNIRGILPHLATLGCDIVDVDSQTPVALARAALGPGPALLGGIDPVRVLQQGSEADVMAAIADCHRQAGDRYIVGAGCEVPPDTPPGNLQALLRYARRHPGLGQADRRGREL
jgi:MtaA/CmuA family methyltransferase